MSAATLTPVATATPAPSPSPTAITHGPVTVVAGTSDCPSIDFGTVTTDSAGVQHARGGGIACTHTVNDPRVSGAYTATWNLDWWGTADHRNGALVQWGTARLANAGGAWDGLATGIFSSDRGDSLATWYKGTGGYAGLAYFTLESGRGPWTIQGQVLPGTPPPPYAEGGSTITRSAASGPVAENAVAVVTGTADCPGLVFDFTADPDGTWHVRDDYHADRCTLTTDDPRVTGVRSSTWNFDLWGNPSAGVGAGVQWGTPRLENDGGAWEGRATGVVSLPGRGDIIVNWYTGTGGYEGLGYFELWTGSGPWRIQGQIFPGEPPTP